MLSRNLPMGLCWLGMLLLFLVGSSLFAASGEPTAPRLTSGGQVDANDTATTQPKVGDKAPNFSLQTLDHKTVKLSELRKSGSVVVIQLRGWVGYQCPLCNIQVGEFISHAKELQAAGARVVMIYPGPAGDLEKRAAEFISGKSLPHDFYFVTDPDMKFANAWGLRWDAPRETAYPATFVINKEGVVRFAKVSQSHGDRAQSAQVLAVIAEQK